METIHQRIKRLREAKGMSKAALARAVKQTYQNVQHWEKGPTAPARKVLQEVALALGVTPQELLYGAPAPVKARPGGDPRVEEMTRLFEMLTTDEKASFMGNLRRMATHNAAVMKELAHFNIQKKTKKLEKV
jgi:transcriptional regulator with XRE-family HTH domain